MIIITCAPAAEQIAANEICLLDPGAKFFKRISQGVCLFEINNNVFFNNIQNQPPVFIRHIIPVNLCFEATSEADIARALLPLFELMDKSKPFSVQTRIFSKDSVSSPISINSRVSEVLLESGFALDIKNPVQIISIAVTSDMIYAGLSTPEINISKWSGGAPIYSKGDSFISRAEFKLLEALEVFDITLTPGRCALDLGAAPGGWSKVLVSGGLKVTAVDPAVLSLALEGKVTYVKSTAQQFFRQDQETKFDVITNDMKIDIDDTIDILFEAKKYLSDNGIVIATLKLPEKNQQKTASRAIRILSSEYSLTGARQLFHNRSEICVVLRL